MKPESTLICAEQHTPQVITCSLSDQLLKRLPVSVVFFYPETLQQQPLMKALKQVLSDFPLFAGRFKQAGDQLLLDCNNAGVSFSVQDDDLTLKQALHQLPSIERKRFVDKVDAKRSLIQQSPILTIKLTNFSGGGSVLGLCWHHSTGDMHTFMSFMMAWSAVTNGKDYTKPLIVHDRMAYLEEHLKNKKIEQQHKEKDNRPSITRYLNTKALIQLLFYLVGKARRKTMVRAYFSESELQSMQQAMSEQAGRRLSINDALCAHLLALITDLDDSQQQTRTLAIVINYRAVLQLPKNLLGNLSDAINIMTHLEDSPVDVAKQIRESVNTFKEKHFGFFATKQYVEQHGGMRKIRRFMNNGTDPIKRTLLISNLSGSGVYRIAFAGAKPFYFTLFRDYPLPWICSLTKGPLNQGLIYSAPLPNALARLLTKNLPRLHQYRDLKEALPDCVQQLPWLM
ncbi:MAG: acyltransferase [Cyanobacteria bacterium P01_D01_bin.105]